MGAMLAPLKNPVIEILTEQPHLAPEIYNAFMRVRRLATEPVRQVSGPGFPRKVGDLEIDLVVPIGQPPDPTYVLVAWREPPTFAIFPVKAPFTLKTWVLRAATAETLQDVFSEPGEQDR
ncbi:hypothetical protein ABZ897_23375 [Nonomuraea sp. NPDC046802]|uniref:hypothetical protein n=1 Tax=Nonomuraea sp. NPDC046802 TaxID=3154919 RepID=UPI0033E0A9E7